MVSEDFEISLSKIEELSYKSFPGVFPKDLINLRLRILTFHFGCLFLVIRSRQSIKGQYFRVLFVQKPLKNDIVTSFLILHFHQVIQLTSTEKDIVKGE